MPEKQTLNELAAQQKDRRQQITDRFTQGVLNSPRALKERRKKAAAAVDKAAAAAREEAIQKELAETDTEE
jgi:hypothetical protein